MTEGVFIGIGTNLGDREANCVEALLRISRFASVEKVSPLYETEPVGVENSQPFFLNAVAMIGDAPAPEELLWKLQTVEKNMGRNEKGNNKARIIDLDILFHGDISMESEKLKIPHPLLYLRQFILEPMSRIAPDFIHPVLGKTVREMMESANDKTYVKMWKSRFFPHPPVEKPSNFVEKLLAGSRR